MTEKKSRMVFAQLYVIGKMEKALGLSSATGVRSLFGSPYSSSKKLPIFSGGFAVCST